MENKFESISRGLGDGFVENIAEANKTEMGHSLRVFNFWDKSDECLID